MVLFLLVWQILGKEDSIVIAPLPFVDKPVINTPTVEPIACKSAEDCRVDAEVVHCPAEARCEDNFCKIYCVYDDVDVNELEPFSVSECQDNIDPLSVRSGEYQLKWLSKNNLKISFNIVLACNIDSLSGSYELDGNNQITLNYEYFVKGVAGPCLCVRNLKYHIPNLDEKENYKVIINKIEK